MVTCNDCGDPITFKEAMLNNGLCNSCKTIVDIFTKIMRS
jgi:transcription initiation factor IIE alpha subunit